MRLLEIEREDIHRVTAGEAMNATDNPSDIVGHKTFDTGETGPDGFPVLRHEPLTRAEGEALWAAAKERERKRHELMPDEQAAIKMLWEAHQRLKELGWKEPQYGPKDGTHFKIIELGSTGIFDGAYSGEWPNGHWLSWDDRDSYCSSIAPALIRLYPEDEAKEKAKWEAAAKRWRETQENKQ